MGILILFLISIPIIWGWTSLIRDLIRYRFGTYVADLPEVILAAIIAGSLALWALVQALSTFLVAQ
jgi:hypothetical protein